MLNIIYGRAGVGKTYTVSELIKKDVQNGKSCILLVPEQFTFESEKTLLQMLGNFDSRKVTVLSFTRLFDEITRLNGGNSKYVVNDAEKCIFMSRALKTVKDNLKIWNKYDTSPNFITNAVNTVNELKLAGISPEDLSDTEVITNKTSLQNKLHDIALIYSAYDALLVNKFIDPVDKMNYINGILLNNNYFSGKNVYIDSFKAFAGVQYKIIERIISAADNVTFSITCDNINSDFSDIFSGSRKTLNRIIKIAEKYGVKISEHKKLTETHYNNDDVAAVEQLLACGSTQIKNSDTGNVTVYNAADKNGEASFTAREIRKLVRTENYRYNDFVVISRNAEDYSAEILNECAKNKVFCFADYRTKLSDTPIIIMIINAINTVTDFTTENILKYLKTGFGTLSFDEISELENYVYLWNENEVNWNTEWKMNPDGFVVNSDNSEKKEAEIKARLLYLNELRIKAIKPLITFKEEYKGNVKNYAAAIYNLLLNCNVAEKLKNLLKTDDGVYGITETETVKQSYKYTVNMLDSMVKCFDDEIIKENEFTDCFNMITQLTTIGNVPQMIDEVTFGSADRIRPSRPKVVFVLGANQQVFPGIPKNTGLFGINDRDCLIKYGFDISDNTLSASIDENMLVYSSLCCATDKIYITYASSDINGEKIEASAFIDNIIKNVNGVSQIEQSFSLNKENLPETEITAFEEYCKNIGIQNGNTELFDVLKENEQFSNRTNALDKKLKFNKTEISKETSSELFGKDLRLSASQFDSFHKCAFSYFCKYGLKAKVPQQAKLDALQRGTISHYALEKFVNNHKTDIRFVNKDDAKLEIEKYINEYLNLIDGIETVYNERFKYLIQLVTEGTVATVLRIIEEFNYSLFNPEQCEMKIGNDENDPSVNLNFGENGKMSLNGSIDRVDTWDNFVRIIDYKTGEKSFRLSDVLLGLNMQMLIYLYALKRSDVSVYKDYTPAGILYQISKKNLKSENTPSNGLLLENETVSNAMNCDNDGRFLPALKYSKDGELKGKSHIQETTFDLIFDYIEFLAEKMLKDLNNGNITINPADGTKDACDYCDFNEVCMFSGKHRSCDSKTDVIKTIKEILGENKI